MLLYSFSRVDTWKSSHGLSILDVSIVSRSNHFLVERFTERRVIVLDTSFRRNVQHWIHKAGHLRNRENRPKKSPSSGCNEINVQTNDYINTTSVFYMRNFATSSSSMIRRTKVIDVPLRIKYNWVELLSLTTIRHKLDWGQVAEISAVQQSCEIPRKIMKIVPETNFSSTYLFMILVRRIFEFAKLDDFSSRRLSKINWWRE